MRSMGKTGAVLATVLLLAACAARGPVTDAQGESAATSRPSAVSHGGAVRDHVSFVDAVRGRGVTVEIAGTAEQPFLRGKGTQLRLSGGGLSAAGVQSYNYDPTDLGGDAAQAVAEDIAQIGPDGNPTTSKITWVAPPHLYRAERLVVLYLGSDAAVQKLLSDLIGPQFAGE